MRRALQVLGWVFVVLLLAILGTAGWAWVELGRSVAQLEGVQVVNGLSAPVTVDRDALGIPTLTGATRADVARALGFVHGQDRFFQMDLLRRGSAGELSELFGSAALTTDRAARLHRFRPRAAVALDAADADVRALVDAYTSGVNAGLQALGAVPFEYRVLGKAPAPWVSEDSLLVVASMYFDLQDELAIGEARTALLHEVFPTELADFLNSSNSDWDTPMQGRALPPVTPPDAGVFDLRTTSAAVPPTLLARGSVESRGDADAFAELLGLAPSDDARGSNSWVVAGSRTADGRALLSNDMHLGLRVPNIWYRAQIAWTDSQGAHRVTGVTLPGAPFIVAGSNGHIAWGFTNTAADWTDRVLLDVVDGEPARYLTPSGPREFAATRERISVDGEGDQWVDVRETIWGPVVGPDYAGRLFAIAWVAHDPEGMNLNLSRMEKAWTIEEAMEIANRANIPAQNCVLADDSGHIAWTVAGRVPRRIGFTGELPVSWADGSRRWDGRYEPSEYPRIVNPPDGVIVTANNRIVSGTYREMLGADTYDVGARARQILDDVRAVSGATAADMLAVQLDDRALMMERWRTLALETLDPMEPDSPAGRVEFRRLVKDDWTGRASIDSAGYRLVRRFRLNAGVLAYAPFVARLREKDSTYPAGAGRSLEGAVWALLTTQPPHLLDPSYESWRDLILAAIDRTAEQLTRDGRALADRTWGEANTLAIQHPLSRAIPYIGSWLDMPAIPMPGDSNMPRVQTSTSGASERLTVSPGHESDGYFHMATGQSGNPRSPHYRDGHDAWVRGEATPFLPGPTVATLTLKSPES
jgi:penicillin amidase